MARDTWTDSKEIIIRMRILIDVDGRYDRTPDGAVWVKSGCLYDYWRRYLEVFDEVRLVARAREVPSVPAEMQRVDGERVCFVPLPYYEGPWQYLTKARAVRRAAQSAFEWGDAVILCGSPISALIHAKLAPRDYPFGARVVGDPYNVFAPGAIVHPLRPFCQWWSPRLLRKLCSGACAAIYVTQTSLQQAYPCPGLVVGASDVDLPAEAFVPEPRRFGPSRGPVRLLMAGSLSQLYKAPDVLIDAVAECVQDGLDVHLMLAGGGRHLPELQAQAQRLGLNGRVAFPGQIPRERVFEEFDRSDLFVLPSRQEGLPRVLIEAMARGLPCIGSAVGGIPELLPAEDLVPPDDAGALASRIREVVLDPERMNRMSERNLSTAHGYRDDVLRERWLSFYWCLRERTEQWLKTHHR